MFYGSDLTCGFQLWFVIVEQDKATHSIAMTLSREKTVVIDYDGDQSTDMFQVSVTGRSVCEWCVSGCLVCEVFVCVCGCGCWVSGSGLSCHTLCTLPLLQPLKLTV